MELWTLWAGAAAWLLTLFTIAWLICTRLQDVTPLDSLWGPALASVGVIAHLLGAGSGAHSGLAALLVVLWGARLGWHMNARWRREGREDPRYAAMRAERTDTFSGWSLYAIFWLQAVLAILISAPLVAAGALPSPTTIAPLIWGFAVIALAGLALETVADLQLSQFRSDPANHGRLLQTGLWGWSRHPNYLGESVFWWALGGLVAASTGAVWALLAPALLTLLLLKVSGVAMADRRMAEHKPEFAAYAARVPAFLPWPRPKRR